MSKKLSKSRSELLEALINAGAKSGAVPTKAVAEKHSSDDKNIIKQLNILAMIMAEMRHELKLKCSRVGKGWAWALTPRFE